MKAILHGYKQIKFSSADGKEVEGTQLFISCADNTVIGEVVDKLFVNKDFPLPDLKPGMSIDILYNRRGKAEQITALPEPQKAININKQ